MGTQSFVAYRNTVTVTGDIIYPPTVTLRLRNRCYVTVTLLIGYVQHLKDTVTPKRLDVTPGVLRLFGQHVPGQAGQSVRFPENNAKCNASLALSLGLITKEGSELLVL